MKSINGGGKTKIGIPELRIMLKAFLQKMKKAK